MVAMFRSRFFYIVISHYSVHCNGARVLYVAVNTLECRPELTSVDRQQPYRPTLYRLPTEVTPKVKPV